MKDGPISTLKRALAFRTVAVGNLSLYVATGGGAVYAAAVDLSSEVVDQPRSGPSPTSGSVRESECGAATDDWGFQ